MASQLGRLLGTAALLAVATHAQAQVREASHTLGSASDVWRVELKNPERLLAMSAGDTDGVSELHTVEVKLVGSDGQMHGITESNPYFRVNDGLRTTRKWVGVRQGDRVKLDRVDDRNPDTYNLWVHSKQQAPGGASTPMLRFEIQVTARELDCRGDTVCRRSDSGTTTYRFNMPIPTNRSLQCIPENRYRISAVNGATMQLTPLIRGGDRRTETGAPEYSGTSSGIGIASGAAQGPHLALQGGEICIAATRMLPSLPDVSREPPPIPRNRKLPGS